MSKRYSGKSFKDSSVMKKPKLSLKEKRKIKKEKIKNKKWGCVNKENASKLWKIIQEAGDYLGD